MITPILIDNKYYSEINIALKIEFPKQNLEILKKRIN
jgi:hypothetical protein